MCFFPILKIEKNFELIKNQVKVEKEIVESRKSIEIFFAKTSQKSHNWKIELNFFWCKLRWILVSNQNHTLLDWFEIMINSICCSASAPVFSTVIALLNEALQAQGHPVLGFLNPWLYGIGKNDLNDIVNGGSDGCEAKDMSAAGGLVTPLVPFPSWNATFGWDPVTGLHTPDYKKLLQLVLSGEPMQLALPGQPTYGL